LARVSARPRALRRAIGELIAGRVQATARVAGAKTNLRIVLLFATLARATVARQARETRRSAVEGILGWLDVGDAAAAFGAIALAQPGGLGQAPAHDVRAPARVSSREAMAAAAHRDSIASEYATGYTIVFECGLPC
jgi:triphosphoribosyl-dephospho-CoA synthase